MTIGEFLLGILCICISLFLYSCSVLFVYIFSKLGGSLYLVVIADVIMFLIVFILGTLILIEALEILGYQEQVERFFKFLRIIDSFFKKEIGHD